MTLPLSQAAPHNRNVEAPVDPLFVERWSHRAISERSLPPELVNTLFEAARWAPSASNQQPWLFIKASQPEHLERARSLLKEGNQRWATRAPLLVFVFARKRNPETGQALRTALFDTGAAWQSLALQAHKLGLTARAMGGVLHENIYEALRVPREDYESVVAVAIGYPGEVSNLPEDLQLKEVPNGRKSARDFVFEGVFPGLASETDDN